MWGQPPRLSSGADPPRRSNPARKAKEDNNEDAPKAAAAAAGYYPSARELADRQRSRIKPRRGAKEDTTCPKRCYLTKFDAVLPCITLRNPPCSRVELLLLAATNVRCLLQVRNRRSVQPEVRRQISLLNKRIHPSILASAKWNFRVGHVLQRAYEILYHARKIAAGKESGDLRHVAHAAIRLHHFAIRLLLAAPPGREIPCDGFAVGLLDRSRAWVQSPAVHQV